MKAPHALLRLDDGREVALGPGAIIGRVAGAALRLNDPRVSEAHALVSLRGRELRLLALRGLLSLGRRPLPSLALVPGQRVLLAPDLGLQVLEVVLPDAVLALDGPWGPPVELTAPVYALLPEGPPSPRYAPGAPAHVWSGEDGWCAQRQGEEPVPIQPGMRLEIGSYNISVVLLPLEQTLVEETANLGGLQSPVRVVASFDTVHIEREGEPPLVLVGNQARMVSELVAFGAPVEWELVAQQIWTGERDRAVLRQNWDRNLSGLRSRLKAAGVRPDLVLSDGKGKVELLLLPDDQVEDRG